MDNDLISTQEARSELKKLAQELVLLRNSRSQLAGRRDPISQRNIKHLSVSIRHKTDRHNELRQILIDRGVIEK